MKLRFYEHASQDLTQIDHRRQLVLLQPVLAKLEQLQTHVTHPLRILDLGAGIGMHANYLVEEKNYNVVAVEHAADLIESGIRNYPKVHFVQDCLPDLSTLGEKKTFDAIISIANFHSLDLDDEEFSAAIKRMVSLLKPGGIFYLVWPNPCPRDSQYSRSFEDFAAVVQEINTQSPEEPILLHEGTPVADPEQRKGFGDDHDKEVIFYAVHGRMPLAKLEFNHLRAKL